MSRDNKVERDLLGIGTILGDFFGAPAIGDAVRRAEKNTPKARQSVASTDQDSASEKSEASGDEGIETLNECPDCGTFYLTDHECTTRGVAKHSEVTRPELFYCAFGRSGKFLGAFASPGPAFTASDAHDGFVKRLPKDKVPK